MEFGGIQKTSFNDYPKKISVVLFTKGCNFKCPYCHNGHLVKNDEMQMYSEDYILDMLKNRKHLVDAVVISGGEPTLHGENLITFMLKLKALGFLVKLDTNGTSPAFIKRALYLGCVDYLAMDIKGPTRKYEEIVKTTVSISDIEESIQLIMNSGIAYEFRTTVVGGIHVKKDISDMIAERKDVGLHYLQNFKDNEGVLEGKNVFVPVDFLNEVDTINTQVILR